MESARSMFVDADDFNPENVYYAKPRTNTSGGKNVSILDSSIKKQLVLSTPLMLTWGANIWTAEDTGKKSYDLSLQFPRDSDENYDKCKRFLDSLKKFEEKILKDALVNSKEWFGKKYELAPIVEALYTPMLRYPKDERGEIDHSRAPSLRVKIPYWDGKFSFELYDQTGHMLYPTVDDDSPSPTTLIVKGQKIATIIKCGGIWFAGGKFGVTWKLVQAVLQPRMSLKGKCYINLNSAERSELEEETKKFHDDDGDDDDAVVATQVENSDDEGEQPRQKESNEPASVKTEKPEPGIRSEPGEQNDVTKPTKKRVVRKKVDGDK